ncbi:MAG: hypothetical protein A3D24_01625 [Candidatus Blackburnbacteria bacterium RIFCSPHIGHO2_02_FULL_39_13]|nr:MAG: hypothetical protein A3D24_01625 [Candidatus Blackburnbacteria bacterium RIFCSPHIGHO2_02_FULL_39_13]
MCSYARILWAAFRPATTARRASLAILAGQSGWEILKSPTMKENNELKASSTPVRVLGYKTRF